MLLTKKDRLKAILLGVIYFLLAVIIDFISSFFTYLSGDRVLVVCEVILAVMCPLSIISCLWAYGNKILTRATKLVYNELRPGQFIEEYDALRNSPNLVVNKPSQSVFQLVAYAYYLMGEREKCLETYDEMIKTANAKKRPYATLLKVSAMYEYGMCDEAEKLFLETQRGKLTLVQVGLVNNVIKHERAMVRGDYNIAESSMHEIIGRDFPKPNNSELLVCHWRLAKIHMEKDEIDLAIPHLDYCATSGGETAIRTEAMKKLSELTEK